MKYQGLKSADYSPCHLASPIRATPSVLHTRVDDLVFDRTYSWAPNADMLIRHLTDPVYAAMSIYEAIGSTIAVQCNVLALNRANDIGST
jgi:hypothetical protein